MIDVVAKDVADKKREIERWIATAGHSPEPQATWGATAPARPKREAVRTWSEALWLADDVLQAIQEHSPYVAISKALNFMSTATWPSVKAELGEGPGRSKGGPAAARARHIEHVDTKVEPYREEHRKRLDAGERSPAIIDDMAKKYDPDGYAKNHTGAVKRMRDTIKPRRART